MLLEQLQATLGDAYTIERELGGGGMSRVFLATENRLHRKVVVKVLSPDLAAAVNTERFEREIQLISRRHHMMKCEKIRVLPICSRKYRRISMTMTRRITVIPSSVRSRFARLLLLIVGISSGFPAVTTSQQSRTQIVMLGTGTPIPDPDRMGQAIAIVVDSTAYLFDAGTGVGRRAAAAGRKGVKAFAGTISTAQPSPRFDRVFLTHLHSDHTLGLADVIFTPWIQGRKTPLDIYGPPGTKRLVNGILDGNSADIAERVHSSGGPPANGWKAIVHEIHAGEVFHDSRVTVTTFAVPHADWKYAFGYRVQTPDGVIVLSGDTRPSPAIAEQCHECDVLIHEVYSDSGFVNLPAARKIYHAHAHTSATQLGDIATRAKPKLLILTHQLFFGSSDEKLLEEVRSHFNGNVVSAKDLDTFTLSLSK